ncbi:MAG: hypothetical protein HY698_07645 [Deltaproteobacteria bacterium]|nr:hypothetical protein [Deltaproteobacteria bacterium]
MSDNYGFTLGGLQPNQPPRKKGAEKVPLYQLALARYVRALVDELGWRPDVIGTHRVPWIPAPSAEEMLRFFHRESRLWLDRDDIPDEEKRPQLITNARDEAVHQFGSIQFGNLVPDEANFEKGPEAIAVKAAALLPVGVGGGRPVPLFLKPDRSFWFLYRLDALATHLDKLRGVPQKIGTFLEDAAEGLKGLDEALTRKVRGGIEGGLHALVKLPDEMVVKPVQRTIGVVTLAAVALAVLFVVTRK